jgi:HEAT repeat protein
VIQEIKPLLKHSDTWIRVETLRLYQRFGSVLSTQQANDIIPLLQDKDKEVSVVAAYALAAMKERAQAAVPKLKSMLTSRDSDVVVAATWRLQNIDRPTRSKRLKELLQELQGTKSDRPRYHMLIELGNLIPIELRPQLEQLRNHANAEVRKDAGALLADITAYQRQQKALRQFQ